MAKKKIVKKKKTVKKKSSPKKAKRTVSAQSVEIKMQPILVENFITLQKVMVNLSSKFETLNVNLSKLLELFELSAKTLAKKDFKLDQTQENEKVLNKLGELSEQNKIIAKGLTLMHEPAPAPVPVPAPMIAKPAPPAQAAPATPAPNETPKETPKEEGYKKSTTFKPLKPKSS